MLLTTILLIMIMLLLFLNALIEPHDLPCTSTLYNVQVNMFRPICQSANLPICQSANLPIWPICQSANLPIWPICQSANLPIWPICKLAGRPICKWDDQSENHFWSLFIKGAFDWSYMYLAALDPCPCVRLVGSRSRSTGSWSGESCHSTVQSY